MQLAFLASAVALAGCVPVTDAVPSACGADGMQNLVGQDKAVFAAMTFPMGTRIIEPGMPVTADFSAERLNFDLDKTGRIVRVWCG
jgi:hypothetical protein